MCRYYIFEITDLYDSANINKIELENNIYAFEISSDLRADDVLGEPTLIAEVLKSNNVDSSIKITANYDYDNLVKLFPDADFKLLLSVCNRATSECGSYGAVNINNSDDYILLNKDNSKIYNNNDLIIETDIRNSSELILISL